MKRLFLIAFTAVLASCGGIKLSSSSYVTVSEKETETDLDTYSFIFEKKAGDYLEVVEVKLLNKEAGMEEPVPFKILDANGKKTILDVKGRSEFTILATKPTSGEKTLASSAVVVYKSEPDGSNKYYTVKKIGN